MDVIPYEHKYLSHIKIWISRRGMDEKLATELPRLGFMVVAEDLPICAGFLRIVEGGHALFDSLITNPISSPEDRNLAIEILVQEIIKKAKQLSLKSIIAHSTDTNTLKRSLSHGFKHLPDMMISLDLRGS